MRGYPSGAAMIAFADVRLTGKAAGMIGI